ncbi:chemotaxis protein CheW [Reinekea sp.]|jgi:chemosensory pili system protein ChpC|uniref:chemotaxis protein CheW n=1 Tax=Reinekea sp. TaxID=1970455 RepID=UPI002A81D539|nr:chemotaxis protein CheW [Reinekea sp.]
MKTPSRLKAQSVSNLVASLLIPVQNKSLLVPNIVVAEVVSLQTIAPLADSPSWALGSILWRGEQVPVMSFEIANSQVHARDSEHARLAVINAVSGQSRFKYFAILVQGIPRMIKLTQDDVREDKQVLVGHGEKMAVITQLGKAVIPDLEYLEALLGKL